MKRRIGQIGSPRSLQSDFSDTYNFIDSIFAVVVKHLLERSFLSCKTNRKPVCYNVVKLETGCGIIDAAVDDVVEGIYKVEVLVCCQLYVKVGHERTKLRPMVLESTYP